MAPWLYGPMARRPYGFAPFTEWTRDFAFSRLVFLFFDTDADGRQTTRTRVPETNPNPRLGHGGEGREGESGNARH